MSMQPLLQLTLTGEIYLKTPAVRRRFARALCDNAVAALGGGARVEETSRGRLTVSGVEDLTTAAERLTRVFGVRTVDEVVPVPFPDLDRGVEAVAELVGADVEGKVFAVRCKRVGSHRWRSADLERKLGALLYQRSAGVDLTDPEVWVRLRVVEDQAFVTRRRWSGPGGLPLGVQGKALMLLSGGYDSAVSAHQLMRRGVAVEFLHLELACSQRDQALAVAHRLWERWGAGMEGVVHVLDFAAVRSQLLDRMAPRLRQVVLKRMMLQAADAVASELGLEAIGTGEAIGQVSSQTFTHVAALDLLAERPVFRPLLTWDKEEIIAAARRVGVAELAERAGEACDLSEGHRVETGLSARAIARAADRIPPEVLSQVLSSWRVHHLDRWLPGDPGERRAA